MKVTRARRPTSWLGPIIRCVMTAADDAGMKGRGARPPRSGGDEDGLSTPAWVFTDDDRTAMGIALEEASLAMAADEVPVGAVILASDGQIVARSGNRRERDGDPTAHAEILALREAGWRLGTWHLDGCTLYVTAEPCAMCAAACVLARLACVVWAAADPKAGFAGSRGNLLDDPRLNHRVAVRAGLRAAEAAALLSSFFAKLRDQR